MRIIFMGTPEFAVPSLDMLVGSGYEVAAVVTQPDKPKGRGNKLTAPPVKEYAEKHGIKILQPEKIRTQEVISELRAIKPDLLVTAAYGKILSKDILDISPLGCINVHGSLLPKYRGAAPIQWAVINGEKVTGITTMFTDIGMDTGDMLLKREIAITADMTYGELYDKMAIEGAELLKHTLFKLEARTLARIPQNENEATYAPVIQKETGKIEWKKSAREVHNLVRGTDPWPGAFTFYKGNRMRVWKTVFEPDGNWDKPSPVLSQPGTICKVVKDGILVVCGTGLLKIIEVQIDSGKRMKVEEYLKGHIINEGEIFEQ